MASRKEEKEQLRKQRLAAETGRSSDMRLYTGYAVAGLAALAVLVGLVIVLTGGSGGGTPGTDGGRLPDAAHVQTSSGVFAGLKFDGREGTPPPELQFGDLAESIRKAGCEAHLNLKDYGKGHFTDEKKRDWSDYETAPPASGDHYGVPNETVSGALADGAYTSTPVAGRAVHALEHGRIEIQYSSKLPEADQLALKGVFDEDSSGISLFPNDNQPFAVAVVAWRNYVGCKTYDPLVLDVVRNFIDTYRGNAPEAIPVNL